MATTSKELNAHQDLAQAHRESAIEQVVLSFTIKDYLKHYELCLKKKAASAKFEGFRVGKAPLRMTEERYRSALNQEAVDLTIQAAVYQYLDEHQPLLASPPKISPSSFKYNEDSKLNEFQVIFEKFPLIKVKKLAGLSFSIPTTLVPKEYKESLLKDFLYTRATKYDYVQDGARARDHITFSIQVEDSFTQELPAVLKYWCDKKHEHVLVEENSLIGLFEPTLLGILSQKIEEIGQQHVDFEKFLNLKPQESFSTILNFDSYAFPVKLTLEEIQRPIISELTPLDFKKLGYTENSTAELDDSLREQAQLQVAIFKRYKLKQALLNALQELYPDIALPASFVETALERLPLAITVEEKHDLLYKPFDELNETQKKLLKMAQKKATPDVILGALCSRYNISPDISEIDGLVRQSEAIMKARGFSLNLHKNDKATYLEMMRQYVLEEKVTQILQPHIILNEPEISFEEFLNYSKYNVLPQVLNLDAPTTQTAALEPEVMTDETVLDSKDKSKVKKKRVAAVKKPKKSEKIENIAEHKL